MVPPTRIHVSFPDMLASFLLLFSSIIGIMGIEVSQISLTEAQLHNFPAIWPV